ncbi:phage tail protein [Comamonas thiooxydans]|uniref:phage tail protein n=1 Tax=Comamonas thiooxydans TaxID=363952 RepID=UPI00209C0076|nr:phage tail protein [Comamonas thiooxydans]MCO8251100.1 phage tail protein [Comamonas thiooxydans]
MPEIFGWRPLSEPRGTVSHRTLRAQFGDGYAQVAGDGINPRKQSWPLEFRGRAGQIKPIRDFLDRHAGARSFTWTPPLGDPGHYLAGEYQVTPHGGRGPLKSYTLSVTFTEFNRP